MEKYNITGQDIIFSLDIGTRSVIGTVGIVKEKKFNVIAESYIEHEERAMIDGQIHDINLVVSAVSKVKKDLEGKMGIILKDVAIAAAGRFLRTLLCKSEVQIDSEKEIDKDTIRSLEMTAVKKAEEEINKQTEGKLYCIGYSVKNYFLNGYSISNLLSHKGESISAEVIATFLPRSVVESLYSVIGKVGLNVISLTLEPIAAIEAAIPQNLRLLNLALVDIGAGTSDIAISSKDSICAYGMVPMAGDEVTELIAQNYLIDFNTAERIKRELSIKGKICYRDIMDIDNEVNSNDIIEIISPIVRKIAEEISSKIIELNGGKSPNAVFLVGGGAHTPMIKEYIAKNLNIPIQRIGIRGRDTVLDCICPDNSLGSEGVTVLGIAMVSIKRMGNDFIDIILNDEVVSLFNSHNHTVMDVMMQAKINPKLLIGKNGNNVRFLLNNSKRVSFGTLSENAEIRVNGLIKSIDSEIREGDKVEITFARDGRDAKPRVNDYINKIYSIGFYINDEYCNFNPIAYINDEPVDFNSIIKEGDRVEIKYPESLLDYITFNNVNCENYIFVKGKDELNKSYIIIEGDRIYKKIKKDKEPKESNNANYIKVKVNNEYITLKDKKSYIFVDVFNYVKFDLSISKGRIILLLNDKKAGYNDTIEDGDEIKIYWDNN